MMINGIRKYPTELYHKGIVDGAATIKVLLIPILTEFKGLTYLICYRWNSVIANVGNREKHVEGGMNQHLL